MKPRNSMRRRRIHVVQVSSDRLVVAASKATAATVTRCPVSAHSRCPVSAHAPCKVPMQSAYGCCGRRTFASRHGGLDYAKYEARFEAKASEGSRTGGWEPSACRCRWRAAHPQRTGGPALRIYRRGPPHRVTRSRSMRRKSPTSAWGRSMYSTRKTRNAPARRTICPQRLRRLRLQRLPRLQRLQRLQGCGGCGGCGCGGCGVLSDHGELAASARLEHFPVTLTDAGRRHGRVRPGQARLVLQAAHVDARVRALRSDGRAKR